MSNNIQVAIIEDEQSICEMYKMKLTLSGYNVVTAHNGAAGLTLLEKTKPDLVLLDLKMPVMSGDEMLKELRKTDWGADIKVVILTNISRDEAPRTLQFLHIERYIVKAHYTPSQVVDLVTEILSQ